jgi:hypothetical protein
MITLGTTYYNNPENLIQFVESHIDHFDKIMIVDDGSSDPATNYIKKHKKISLYRVLKDYGFNSHGCRNLIMKNSDSDWNVLMDIDRIFIDPIFSVNYMKTKKLNENVRYKFEAFSKSLGLHTLHESVNDYLINKTLFWKAGGYDEENIGMRFGDREFFAQLNNFGTEKLLHGIQIHITRIPSLTLNICSQEDILPTRKVVNLIHSRILQPNPNKPILQFEWEKVF